MGNLKIGMINRILLGLLFLILLFLLELTLGILFGYISNNLYKRYRKLHPRSQITPKAVQKVAVPKKERKAAKQPKHQRRNSLLQENCVFVRLRRELWR